MKDVGDDRRMSLIRKWLSGVSFSYLGVQVQACMRDSCPTLFYSHWVSLWLHPISHALDIVAERGSRTHGLLPVNVFWACRSWRPSEQLEGGQHDAACRDHEADARQRRLCKAGPSALKCQHVGFQSVMSTFVATFSLMALPNVATMASAWLLESGFPELLMAIVRVQCERTHASILLRVARQSQGPSSLIRFPVRRFENGGKMVAERVGIRSRAVTP